jgi:translation initiation factor 2 subunit 1
MEYPKINDIIVCKITKITDFGVFVALLEFDDMEGFVHISQVSSTWIKNIHNHVKINSVRAAKVLKIDTEKNHIDLSLSKVNDADEKRKIADYRLFLRAQGLMNVIAKDLEITLDKAWEEIGDKIIEKESNLYKGFVNIIKYGQNFYTDVDSKYRKQLFDILSRNIAVKDKEIISVLKISSTESNGAEIIKKALIKINKDHGSSQVTYVAPGRYEIKVTAKDFKIASKKFDEISADILKSLKGQSVEIIKSEESKKQSSK